MTYSPWTPHPLTPLDYPRQKDIHTTYITLNNPKEVVKERNVVGIELLDETLKQELRTLQNEFNDKVSVAISNAVTRIEERIFGKIKEDVR